jgi:hypothetical protein
LIVLSKDSPWLIFVCAGKFQKNGIIVAQALGLNVLAIDGDRNAPGLKYANKSIVVDIKQPKLVLKAVIDLKIKPSGAITLASEVGMSAVGLLRDYFKLPGAGLELTKKLTNKVTQRRIWDQYGLPNPIWELATSENAANISSENRDFPLIIKPADSSGSRGVSYVNNLDEWRVAIQDAFINSQSGEILIESVLPGDEYTVETFSEGGITSILTITKKKKISSTKGTVAYELFVPILDNFARQQIEDTVISALNALSYTNGPGHTEIMYDAVHGVGLIETAGRGPGHLMFEKFIPMASGYDVLKNSIFQSIGKHTEPCSSLNRYVLMRYFPSKSGCIKHISGFDEANKIKGIEAAAFVSIGDYVDDEKNDGARMGYILAHSNNQHSTKALADYAETLINFEVS